MLKENFAFPIVLYSFSVSNVKCGTRSPRCFRELRKQINPAGRVEMTTMTMAIRNERVREGRRKRDRKRERERERERERKREQVRKIYRRTLFN